MAEKSCKDCVFCNLKALSSGKWYCNSPEVSVFDLKEKLVELMVGAFDKCCSMLCYWMPLPEPPKGE